MAKNITLPLDELIHQLRNYPALKITISGGGSESRTFEEWARYWLRTWRLGQVKDNTYQGTYREPIECHLIPYFGHKLLHEIRPFHIQEYFNLKATQYALETLKKQRACLLNIFQTGIENGICDINPVSPTLRLHSDIPVSIKRAWTQEQYTLAYHFAETHPYGIPIMILMETGISRSELLGLTWDDFDMTRCCLTLNHGLIETRNPISGEWELQIHGLKNAHRKRTVPLSLKLATQISKLPRYVSIQKKNQPVLRIATDHICHSPKGKPFAPHNWYARRFQPFIYELMNIYPDIPRLTTHELRHTRATLLTYQGVNLYTIARLLGHKDLSMLSKRYLHDDLEAMRTAIGFTN